jgi:glycosyltransferase involved in cell wall biosynthesis
MLVSADAGPQLRRQVLAAERPNPEFLRLESDHGVELLDWSRLGFAPGGRSIARSIRHAFAGLGSLAGRPAVFSDGEHVGIPLGLAMRIRRDATPHLMIGHHLDAPAKRPWLRLLAKAENLRLIVHSPSQLAHARDLVGVPVERLRLIPYGVDTEFWRPAPAEAEDLVLAAGRDHRDYGTLARAVASIDVRVFVSGHSAHSPRARASEPATWPRNVERGFVDYLALRELYARSAVVVIPLLAADFPAGVTSLLEAMAMGKAIVVTATRGLQGIGDDGETMIQVPPGDANALERVIRGLLADPAEQQRLGRNARARVEQRYSLGAYAAALSTELQAMANGRRRPAA